MPALSPGTPTAPALLRVLGRWDLTAIGINQVIGSAIFLTPSLVAAQLGNWSPLAFVLAGLASLCVALCYAEVGSRFDRTGGPYVYTRAAFGPFVGFQVGWMSWFTRVSSQASIINGLALAVGFYLPAVEQGLARAGLIVAIFLALALVNVRGVRPSALLINVLTVAKLAPLAVFVAVGLFFVEWERLAPLPPISLEQLGAGALLLVFAFGGFDVVGVPAGEARDPRRHLAFALITTLVAVTLVMMLVQIVAMTTLPDVTRSSTPVADAALAFMGPLGALMIGVGSVVSMAGNTAGSLLTAPRMLFALSEHGALPRAFARVHPRWHTPANAIWLTCVVSLVLALSGSFAFLAAASAVSRLLTYTGVSAAALALRRERHAGEVPPALFAVPLGATIPVIAVVVSLAIIAGATARQLLVGGGAMLAGALLYALHAWAVARGGARIRSASAPRR